MWIETVAPILMTAFGSAAVWGVRKIHQHDTDIKVLKTSVEGFVAAHGSFVESQKQRHIENREDLREIKQTLSGLNEHVVELSGRRR